MMRARYILPILAFAIFLGAAGVAHAAATPCTTNAQCTNQQPPGQTCNVAAGVCGFAPDSSFQKCQTACTGTGNACVSDASGNYTCQTSSGNTTQPAAGGADGTVQQGGRCSTDTNCAGNLACQGGFCSVDSSLESSGYGKGDGSVAPGGACSTQNDCSGDNACINAVCAADNGLAAQGETCSSDDDCGGELACDTTSHTCQVDPSLDPSSSTNAAAQKTPSTLNGNPIKENGDTLDWLMAELMSLFAWLLGIAAITLDNAMYYTVVHMGSYVNGLSAVGVAWRILRDIGNIVLIFGFVALGITVILDVNWYGGGTKMLPTLLIAALMLNFSLFAAEAVVDVGNLFATEFYTQINGGQAAAPKDWSGTSVSNEGISTAVMNQLGLQEFYNGGVGANNQNDNAIFQSGHPFIIGFMAILIFMIASFVFFSLAFILIARFVVLVFLIIVAPIGFAGLAVPKLDKTANLWWSTLFEQTITAPVMLLMLYVALAVITDAQFLTGFGVGGTGSGASNTAQNAWIAAVTSTTGTNIGALASVLLSFLVAMGLLLAVTMLAKRMGAIGGQWATNLGGKLTFGATGYVARNTLGRTSNLIGRGIRRVAPNEFGRIAAKPFDFGAKSNFDFRGTGVLKAAQNYDGGKPQKGGYIAEVEAQKKAQLAYGKTLDTTGSAAYLAAKDAHDKTEKARSEAAKAQTKSTRDKAAAEEKQRTTAKELGDLEKRVDPNNFDQILEDKIEEKRKEKDAANTELEAADIALGAAKTSKVAADSAFTASKETLDATPKNSAQERYAKGLKGAANTGPATAVGMLTTGGAGAATGAVIGSLAGPVGTAAGAAAGAALGGWLAKSQGARSSASYQAGSELDKKAKATPIEKMIDEISEATKESAKEQKEHDKKEEAKDEAH